MPSPQQNGATGSSEPQHAVFRHSFTLTLRRNGTSNVSQNVEPGGSAPQMPPELAAMMAGLRANIERMRASLPRDPNSTNADGNGVTSSTNRTARENNSASASANQNSSTDTNSTTGAVRTGGESRSASQLPHASQLPQIPQGMPMWILQGQRPRPPVPSTPDLVAGIQRERSRSPVPSTPRPVPSTPGLAEFGGIHGPVPSTPGAIHGGAPGLAAAAAVAPPQGVPSTPTIPFLPGAPLFPFPGMEMPEWMVHSERPPWLSGSGSSGSNSGGSSTSSTPSGADAASGIGGEILRFEQSFSNSGSSDGAGGQPVLVQVEVHPGAGGAEGAPPGFPDLPDAVGALFASLAAMQGPSPLKPASSHQLDVLLDSQARTFEPKEGEDVGSCPICQDKFLEGELLVQMPCCGNHHHRSCVLRWLGQESGRCPVCRQTLPDAPASPADLSINSIVELKRRCVERNLDCSRCIEKRELVALLLQERQQQQANLPRPRSILFRSQTSATPSSSRSHQQGSRPARTQSSAPNPRDLLTNRLSFAGSSSAGPAPQPTPKSMSRPSSARQSARTASERAPSSAFTRLLSALDSVQQEAEETSRTVDATLSRAPATLRSLRAARASVMETRRSLGAAITSASMIRQALASPSANPSGPSTAEENLESRLRRENLEARLRRSRENLEASFARLPPREGTVQPLLSQANARPPLIVRPVRSLQAVADDTDSISLDAMVAARAAARAGQSASSSSSGMAASSSANPSTNGSQSTSSNKRKEPDTPDSVRRRITSKRPRPSAFKDE